jgi:hypothetical protein
MSSASVMTAALSAAGTGIQAGGELAAGANAAMLGRAQAASLGVQAGQELAQGTQEVANQALSTKYLISATRGAAAGSGGVATSPTVVDLEGQIAARGSYNALSDMYMARQKANALNYQGALDVYSGNVTQRADQVNAFGTVLKGASSLAEKYGGNGASPGFPAGIKSADDVTGVPGYNPSPQTYMG